MMIDSRNDHGSDGVVVSETHRLPLKRVSWSAVFAGVICAFMVHVLLTLLGTAIGASSIDPLKESNPLENLGTGAMIWSGAEILIAIIAGSYIAGRLAQREGALHGLLMFGISTLITIWLAVSLVSSAVTGSMQLLGAGFQALGSGLSAAAPSLGRMANDKLKENNINLDSLQNELETTLRQTGKPQLQPENLQREAQAEANNAGNQVQDTANHPQTAGTDLASWINGVIDRHEDTLQAADRQALKNIIKARTGKSDREADQIVDQAAQNYQQAVQKYQQLKQQAEQKAREVADQAAAATAKASWFAFFMLIVEAILAAVMGMVGRRTQPQLVCHERR